MRTLRALERLITSAGDVQSIVRTMKTIAAVNVRHLEAAVASLRPYDETVRLGLNMLLSTGPPTREARADRRGVRRAAIVIGSDQGLCGSFNDDIARFVCTEVADLGDTGNWSILPIGGRVADRLGDRGLRTESTFDVPGSDAGASDLVADLLPRIDAWRRESSVDEVIVFHNRRSRGTHVAPRRFRLLPIDVASLAAAPPPSASRCRPFVSMERDRLFSAIVRQYLFASLFRACVESMASENASRLASMHAAERSIADRLDGLRGERQQLRQQAITDELNDIVSGFEAQRRERETQTHIPTGVPR